MIPAALFFFAIQQSGSRFAGFWTAMAASPLAMTVEVAGHTASAKLVQN
jgi:hypothetical protein